MDPLFSPLVLQARKETLRYSVQQAMFCPHCQEVLDVTDAVLLEDTKRSRYAIACGKCSERAPFDGTVGCVEVYDGRVLFARRKAKPKRRKTK